MNIALVYDRVNKFGGAERVLQALHEIWPNAPLYTSVYDPEGAPWARGWDVRTSFLQQLPWTRQHHESLGLFMPLAFESLDLSEFDVVISVTSEAAKGVITSPRQLHICYLLTPTRYLWSHANDYLGHVPRVIRPVALIAQEKLRQWDYLSAQRPDHIISISKLVQERCRKYYRRESEVVYPPLQLQVTSDPPATTERSDGGRGRLRARKNKDRNYFLVVSRLVPYKRIDIAIEACRRAGYSLLVIGEGSDRQRLERFAGPTVRFLGHVSDEQLVEYYRGARALLMPQEEDFGLTALEAQACGTPVVTYRNSGAAEVVIDRKTGTMFDEQTATGLEQALRTFESQRHRFRSSDCVSNALQYSPLRFGQEIQFHIETLWNKRHKK